MNADQAKQLRAPFPADAVGKLPRVTCRACSNDKQRKHCDQHQRAKCQMCRNYISTAHRHLDYVGHAEVTDRLLQVDPGWDWQPVSFSSETGLPQGDRHGGLWIRLTVAGVTRLGYGHADGKEGPDAIKEAIGDAIRNAAMRFGVALDLWGATAKQDDDPVIGSGQAPRQQQNRNAARAKQSSPADEARSALRSVCEREGWDTKRAAQVFATQHGEPLGETQDADKVKAFMQALIADPDHVLGTAPAGT